jgi:hypothetical protein
VMLQFSQRMIWQGQISQHLSDKMKSRGVTRVTETLD